MTLASPPPSRRRRTAEEAQRLILDAAEARLIEVGPAALRLQDVAQDVGVSHPTILHHFGSRDDLVAAVIRRALQQLQDDLLAAIRHHETNEATAQEVIQTAFAGLEGRGYGRLMAWLSLSGVEPPADMRRLDEIADAVHARRCGERPPEDRPDREDTLFFVLLASFAVFADSVAGRSMRQSAGLGDDPEAGARFRRWFGHLLYEHLTGADP